jgi:hypothetical protein
MSTIHPFLEPALDGHRQALRGWIDAMRSRSPELRLYALLDIGQHPSLARAAQALGGPQLSLFDGTPEAAAEHLAPRLMLAPPAGSQLNLAWLDALTQMATKFPCVSWIASAVSPEALAAHLRQWLDGVLLDDDGTPLGEVMVRFFDPRVLPALMQTWTPAQKAALMRPIHEWAVWLRAQQWQCWVRSVDSSPSLLPRVAQYTSVQARALADFGRADRLMARLEDASRGPDADPGWSQRLQRQFDETPPSVMWQHLQRLTQQALAHGLSADADLLTYCGLGLAQDERFDEAPAVRDAIALVVSGGLPLSEALAAAAAAPDYAE